MDNLDTNAKFNEQRQQILSIRKEIKLLAQQVDYLLRNEKPLELLDVDVLMNRTHTLYDMLCAVEVDSQDDFEEEDFDEDMVNVLASAVAGTVDNTETAEKKEEAEPVQEEVTEVPESTHEEPDVETPAEEAPVFNINVFDAPIEEPAEEPQASNPVEEVPAENEVVETVVEEPRQESADNADNFVMYFEDMPADNQTQGDDKIVDDYLFDMEQAQQQEKEQEETPVEKVYSDPIFEIVPPKEDVFVEEEEEKEEEPALTNYFDEQPDQIEMPEDMHNEVEINEDTPVDVQPDLFGDETGEPEILGEKMITEDNSLAAKLQNRPVGDLKSAIGINDKFLFVNGEIQPLNREPQRYTDLQRCVDLS